MSDKAAESLANGLMWFGFWLMIGLANFGEEPASSSVADNIVNKMESAFESGKEE